MNRGESSSVGRCVDAVITRILRPSNPDRRVDGPPVCLGLMDGIHKLSQHLHMDMTTYLRSPAAIVARSPDAPEDCPIKTHDTELTRTRCKFYQHEYTMR